ncbi:MAG: hypothetical protein HW387_1541 [Parachlamydiales bacterium]|nr:hypothetical protein [Parachlamydiales bacterium]
MTPDWLLSLAERVKSPAKFDCLKTDTVLGLEDFDFSFFHLVTLIIFICAIIHTLSVNWIHKWARNIEIYQKPHREQRGLWVQTLYFLSEVEIVFAFWAIPLIIAIALSFGTRTAFEYINTRDYTEPLFVVVIMCLSSTRPIVQVAETVLRRIANWLGGSLSAWWYTLLTLGPLLGSFITEIGAMAVCALLLSRQFYEYRPSPQLAYATLGLLFVNISIGSVLTTFASPAVLILAHCWHWNTLYMLVAFGWKAILGILLSNTLYWYYFRKEFGELNLKKNLVSRIHTPRPNDPETLVPGWVVMVHVITVAFIVMTSHYPAIFIGAFLFFLGFHQATRSHQYPVHLTRPLLIGLFLAGLVIHGGLQGWWVVELLERFTPLGVLGFSIVLTAFNDNTSISYLATLVPSWGEAFKYAIFSGVVAGGGLTVIANAPNPAGFAILGRHFDQGISPIKLFLSAAIPTFILYVIFFATGPFL